MTAKKDFLSLNRNMIIRTLLPSSRQWRRIKTLKLWAQFHRWTSLSKRSITRITSCKNRAKPSRTQSKLSPRQPHESTLSREWIWHQGRLLCLKTSSCRKRCLVWLRSRATWQRCPMAQQGQVGVRVQSTNSIQCFRWRS